MFLLTVAAIWTIAAVTPGPNFLVVVRCSLVGGRATALASVGGTICGTLIWGVAGWLGVSALFAAAPAAFIALKIVGGAFIAVLGVRLLWKSRRAVDTGKTAPTPCKTSVSKAFRLGLVTSLANPKSAVFVASVFAAAFPADYHWGQGLSAVTLMVAISTAWYLMIAVLLSHQRIGAAYLGARRRIDALTDAVFIAFGTKLALSER